MKPADTIETWGLSYRLVASVLTHAGREIEAHGVDVKELLLLAALDAHPHPAALSTELSIPKPTVTLMVKRLESAGFVERNIDASDLRRHRLTLTAAGRKTVARAMKVVTDAFDARLGKLTASERNELKRLLAKMVG